MSGQDTLRGTVVEQQSPDGMPASNSEGLYLLTEDGTRLELISTSMATQMPVDMLHRQSRPTFEPYLGKQITVSGYRSGHSLFNAFIEEAPDFEEGSEWEILPPEK